MMLSQDTLVPTSPFTWNLRLKKAINSILICMNHSAQANVFVCFLFLYIFFCSIILFQIKRNMILSNILQFIFVNEWRNFSFLCFRLSRFQKNNSNKFRVQFNHRFISVYIKIYKSKVEVSINEGMWLRIGLDIC